MRKIGIEDYLNLPLKARVAIIAAMVAAAMGAIYLLSYAPKIREIDSTLNKIEQLQEEIDQAVASAQNFTAPTEGEQNAWQRVEAKVEQLVPQGEEFLQLLYQISLITENKAGFNLYYPSDGGSGTGKKVVRKPVGTTIKPKAAGQRTKFFLVRLSLVTEYEKLPGLLEEMHRVNRLMEVESLKVSAQQPGVLVELTLRAYYMG